MMMSRYRTQNINIKSKSNRLPYYFASILNVMFDDNIITGIMCTYIHTYNTIIYCVLHICGINMSLQNKLHTRLQNRESFSFSL